MLFDNLIENFPFESYQMIKDVLSKNKSHSVVSATGMSLLVNLIGTHGEEVIDQLESDVALNPDLQRALEGIYNQGTSDEVWCRIQKLAYTIN